MKTTRLLSTVAVSVLLTGAAWAQMPKSDESPGRAPAAQQQAPAEKKAPAVRGGERQGPSGRSAQDMKPGDSKQPSTTGQAPSTSEPGRSTTSPSKGQSMDKDKNQSMDKNKTMDKTKPSSGSTSGSSSGSSDVNAQTKSKDDATKSGQSTTQQKGSSTTTGQGAASGAAKLSVEQRTKITTVFKKQKVARVEPSKLNVEIRVGAKVPRSVHFYPVPEEVVVIYPEWRGYDYILVGDQIVIIEPRSYEIVAVLAA